MVFATDNCSRIFFLVNSDFRLREFFSKTRADFEAYWNHWVTKHSLTMTLHKLAKTVLINTVPALLLLLMIIDLIEVINSPNAYSFNSEFFSPNSIYRSKRLYLLYSILFAITLFLMILSYCFKQKKAYFTLLAINVVLFVYPMLTNEWGFPQWFLHILTKPSSCQTDFRLHVWSNFHPKFKSVR
jgi:hypothetical protein